MREDVSVRVEFVSARRCVNCTYAPFWRQATVHAFRPIGYMASSPKGIIQAAYVNRKFHNKAITKILDTQQPLLLFVLILPIALWFLLFPVGGYANSCLVTNTTQWNDLGSNCTHVSLENNTLVLNSITSVLRIDDDKFPGKIVIADGTIDGSDSSVKDCVEIFHSNVELKNIEIRGCGRHGIQIGQENGPQGAVGRKVYLEELKLSDIGWHGIYIGRHNHTHPVNDLIRVTETIMEDIGVDGIAGSLGPNGILDVDNTDISLVDQRGKRRLDFDQGLDSFCKHQDIRILGGDCVHLQPVQGTVNIERNRCDHTDMPTKNGFILQNQNAGGNSSGTVNLSDNQILMDRSCLDVTDHSSHVNIKPNGIQIESIENIRIVENEISNVVNGVSLNGDWSFDTCSMVNNQITGVISQGGQEMAGVHFSGALKNCNADASSAVPIVRTELPEAVILPEQPEEPEEAVRVVFTRIDLDPTEYRWIAVDQSGVLGHKWIHPVCGQQLASQDDLDQAQGDWNTMVAMYPGGEPVEPPPCPAEQALVITNKTPVFQGPQPLSFNGLSLQRKGEHDALSVALRAKLLQLQLARLDFDLLKLRIEIDELYKSVQSH